MNIMSSFNQKLSYLPAVHTVLYTRHAKSCPSQEVWTKKKKKNDMPYHTGNDLCHDLSIQGTWRVTV